MERSNHNLVSTKYVVAVSSAIFLAAVAFVVVIPNRAKFWKTAPKPLTSPSGKAGHMNLSNRERSSTVGSICFVRDHFVHLFDPSTRVVKKIVAGESCAISPAADSIAITVDRVEPDKIGHPTNIHIVDLKTFGINDLDFISKEYKRNPLWSPDGSRLAFELAIGSQIHILLLNIASGEWQDVTRNLDFLDPGDGHKTDGVTLNSWSPDGGSIVCQDLSFIYEIATDGNVLQKIPIETITKDVFGDMAFSYSPDRKLIAFSTGTELKTGELNLGIYVFNFETKKLSKITPDTIHAINPMWLSSGHEIIFERDQNRENTPAWDICTISIDSREIKTVVKDVTSSSYSFQ